MANLELDLNQLVALFLPAGFSVSQAYIDNSVKVWQLFLWDAFPEVTENTMFDIAEYPDKALPLFAALVVHDVLTLALTSNFLDGMGAVSSGEGSESGGGVKSIKTGPTEVEFHDSVSALAKLIAASKGEGGLLFEMRSKACMIASNLGISLPFCKSNDIKVRMIKGGVKIPNIARAILRKP